MHLMTPAVIDARPSADGTWSTRVWYLASGSGNSGRMERSRVDVGGLMLATEVLANRLPVEHARLDVQPLTPWAHSPAGAAMVLNALGTVDLTLSNLRRDEQHSASSPR